ncbi:MAG: hypothetical protein ACKOJF_17615, partial [Planctomycetaceae bacterium]
MTFSPGKNHTAAGSGAIAQPPQSGRCFSTEFGTNRSARPSFYNPVAEEKTQVTTVRPTGAKVSPEGPGAAG